MAAAVEQPSKEAVRQWFNDRRVVGAPPPPDPVEIRRQLGWDLLYNMNPLRQECSR